MTTEAFHRLLAKERTEESPRDSFNFGMPKEEFHRLLGYHKAMKRALEQRHYGRSKRSVRSSANAAGQCIKNSRVLHTVGMNTLFVNDKGKAV